MASRVMVSLSDEMQGRVEYYANLFGIPKASLCSMLIGQAIVAYDKSESVSSQIVARLSDTLAEKAGQKIEVRLSPSLGSGDGSGKT